MPMSHAYSKLFKKLLEVDTKPNWLGCGTLDAGWLILTYVDSKAKYISEVEEIWKVFVAAISWRYFLLLGYLMCLMGPGDLILSFPSDLPLTQIQTERIQNGFWAKW